MPADGVVVRTAFYDTEEHANAANHLNSSRPAENFKDGEAGMNAYRVYPRNNNISIISEVIPA